MERVGEKENRERERDTCLGRTDALGRVSYGGGCATARNIIFLLVLLL